VLNAFRHQRYGHLQALVYLSVRRMCSTPFGIRGMGISVIPWNLCT